MSPHVMLEAIGRVQQENMSGGLEGNSFPTMGTKEGRDRGILC